MILTWSKEWENDPSLGIMHECYEALKGKGMSIIIYISVHVRRFSVL